MIHTFKVYICICMYYFKLIKRDWFLLFYSIFVWFSVQNGGCTVMSWAQLLLWSVLLSFASWASILFGKTIIFYICKMLPSSNYMQWWKDSTQQKDYSKFSAREPKHWNLWLTAVSVVSMTHSNILWAFPFTSNAWCRLCCNQSQSGGSAA